LAGVDSYIPFDEVVAAMWSIGQNMSPTIKETALGGLAITPTGLKVRKRLGLPDLKPTETLVQLGDSQKRKKKKKPIGKSRRALKKLF
jgi:hypothetical protein